MLEDILDYEREAFFWLNGSESPLFDRFMWLYTGKVVWLPVAIFILAVLIYKKEWREWMLILLAIALVVTLCDQFTSSFVKPVFERYRPTHHPEFMDEVKIVFGYRGGRYGFMSSHAANAFGFAMFTSLLFRYVFFTWTVFLWAGLTAYTRIYLGVHFISDVIPGALVGMLFAYLVYILYYHTRRRLLHKTEEEAPFLIYSRTRKLLIISAIFITIISLLVFNVSLTTFLR